jgi:hypothetical protein
VHVLIAGSIVRSAAERKKLEERGYRGENSARVET